MYIKISMVGNWRETFEQTKEHNENIKDYEIYIHPNAVGCIRPSARVYENANRILHARVNISGYGDVTITEKYDEFVEKISRSKGPRNFHARSNV